MQIHSFVHLGMNNIAGIFEHKVMKFGYKKNSFIIHLANFFWNVFPNCLAINFKRLEIGVV